MKRIVVVLSRNMSSNTQKPPSVQTGEAICAVAACVLLLLWGLVVRRWRWSPATKKARRTTRTVGATVDTLEPGTAVLRNVFFSRSCMIDMMANIILFL